MLTVMVLFATLLVLAFIVAVLGGLIAISPALLIIICLPLIDILIIRSIIKSMKNKEKK